MSNYTKSTNFATKDNLTPGDPLKVVRGTEIDTEFNNIATAVATKTDNSAAAITGGSITGITDLAVADGGTGASTAAGALNNLLPSQTSAANKYLQSDGTNASWDAVTLSTADITGTLAVANGGTGVTSSTGTGSVVLSNSPTLVTPALGTPASGTLTNATGLPISTGVSGLGTGVATFLGTPSSANLISAVTDETGTGSLVFATSPTLVTPALGTPSALVGTNITGTASGLTAGNVTTNANLTGAVTSVGNATSLGSFTSSQLAGALSDETGSGSLVFATSPTLVTPILGTPTSATLTNATGLPISTGVSGLGTGVATFLATPSSANLAAALTDETGSGANVFATSPTLVTPILGTPTSATLTNATGLPLTTGVTGTLPTANGGTNLGGATPFTSGGVVYASSSSALATGSALTFDGTNLGVGIASATSLLDVRDGVGSILTLGNTGNFGLGEFSRIKWKEGSTQLADIGWEADTNELRINNRVAYTTFYASNAEAMRLTSSSLYTASGINVGIGTSSPSAKLHVGGNALIAQPSAANSFLSVSGSSGSYSGIISLQRGGTEDGSVYCASSNYNPASVSAADLVFSTGGGGRSFRWANNTTIAMTLDGSNNLGLGVPPSAWSTTNSTKVFQISNRGSIWGNSNSNSINNNWYLASGDVDRYIETGRALRYNQSTLGIHEWFTAPSGTAGDAISFTQALTLDADGRLLVGMTSNPVPGKTFSKDTQNPFVSWNPSTSGNSGFIDFGTEATFTERGYIYYNRAAGQTQLSATSDQRLKENIKDATSTLGVINQIKVRQFDWKETGNTNIGFIAQELYEIVPEAVCVGEDNEDGTVKRHWGVSKEYLVPYLVKAIQELKADFDAYKEAHP